MATGQEVTKDPTDRTLVMKVKLGTNLDEQITDYCGENDCSAAAFLREAVLAALVASGREVTPEPESKK